MTFSLTRNYFVTDVDGNVAMGWVSINGVQSDNVDFSCNWSYSFGPFENSGKSKGIDSFQALISCFGKIDIGMASAISRGISISQFSEGGGCPFLLATESNVNLTNSVRKLVGERTQEGGRE